MSIHVEFPEELLVATREDPQAFARKVARTSREIAARVKRA